MLIGGTHVSWSPCFHYLDLQWLPYLRRMGLEADSNCCWRASTRRETASARTHHTGPITAPLNLPERGAPADPRHLGGGKS